MRRFVTATLTVCLLACAAFCTALRAEELTLQDGTKVIGKIIEVSGDSFKVKTAYGEIQVPRNKIVSISFPENQPEKTAAPSKPARVVDESLNGASYTNHTGGFRMTLPDGWISAPDVRADTPDLVAVLKSPDETNFLFVTPEKFAGTMATYQALVEMQYRTRFAEYKKVSESPVKIDGKDAVQLVWAATNEAAHNLPMKSVVYIVPTEGGYVRLLFMTVDTLFDQSFPAFEKVAASYQSIVPQTK